MYTSLHNRIFLRRIPPKYYCPFFVLLENGFSKISQACKFVGDRDLRSISYKLKVDCEESKV